MSAGPGDYAGLIPPAPAWMRDGLCREHPEIVFVFEETSHVSSRRKAEAAAAVCRRCLVREECLAYALEDRSLVGVWGGTTMAERRTPHQPHIRPRSGPSADVHETLRPA
ncbi:MAG: WhiB family transcriptional regulator [Acidimicrobiales bacterium]|nr:WhiB family transcriptional regulator [Acidimicrobiales bacterium]